MSKKINMVKKDSNKNQNIDNSNSILFNSSSYVN